jgi:hypothetical protein
VTVQSVDWTATLAHRLARLGLPEPTREYQFALAVGRRWAFDLAWPEHLLAVEIEGGRWIDGRHTRPKGFAADCLKYNCATLLGWRLLRVVPDWIEDGAALVLIADAFADPAAMARARLAARMLGRSHPSAQKETRRPLLRRVPVTA